MKLMQRGVAVNVFGILISRCIIFGGLTPLGVAFYATLYESKINMIMLFISINLGILSTGIEIIKLKYIISITMLSIVNLINYPKRSLDISIRAFIIFFCYWSKLSLSRILLYDFILVIFESSLILIFSLLFRNGTKYLSDVKEIDSISSEKLISISIIGIFAISGLSNLSIMGISIRNVLIIFIIMLFAKNGGVSIGAVIGWFLDWILV